MSYSNGDTRNLRQSYGEIILSEYLRGLKYSRYSKSGACSVVQINSISLFDIRNVWTCCSCLRFEGFNIMEWRKCVMMKRKSIIGASLVRDNYWSWYTSFTFKVTTVSTMLSPSVWINILWCCLSELTFVMFWEHFEFTFNLWRFSVRMLSELKFGLNFRKLMSSY